MTSTDQKREKRLAAALRQNLKRRKAQARQINKPEEQEKTED
jgi:hypothetical protein